MKTRVTILQLEGALKDAIEELRGELEGNPDVFDRLTPQSVARQLIVYGLKEHRAGRGPWAR